MQVRIAENDDDIEAALIDAAIEISRARLPRRRLEDVARAMAG